MSLKHPRTRAGLALKRAITETPLWVIGILIWFVVIPFGVAAIIWIGYGVHGLISWLLS